MKEDCKEYFTNIINNYENYLSCAKNSSENLSKSIKNDFLINNISKL